MMGGTALVVWVQYQACLIRGCAWAVVCMPALAAIPCVIMLLLSRDSATRGGWLRNHQLTIQDSSHTALLPYVFAVQFILAESILHHLQAEREGRELVGHSTDGQNSSKAAYLWM